MGVPAVPRCLKVSTSTPPQTASTATEPLVLFFGHFGYRTKSGWKKVALKIQFIIFIVFIIRQAKN